LLKRIIVYETTYDNIVLIKSPLIMHVPSVYAPEWIGIAVIIGFAIFLVYRKKITRFIRKGLVL